MTTLIQWIKPLHFTDVVINRKGYAFWTCQDHFKRLCFSKGKRAPAAGL